jgi:hypothetical protein
MSVQNREGAWDRAITLLERLALGSAVPPSQGAGTYTMVDESPVVQILLITGAVTVLLPPEKPGRIYFIWNKAGSALDITVKDDSNTTTILTISQNEAGILFCDDALVWQRMLMNAAAT